MRRTTSPAIAAAGPHAARRTLAVLGRPAVAAVAVAAALTGAGAAAAGGWLPAFRTEQVAPLRVTTAELAALPDLGAYGDVVVTAPPDLRPVADATTAAAETGLDVPEVAWLPRGVDGEPVHHVGGEVTATFTYSAQRTAEAAAKVGAAPPTPPPGLDGTVVRLAAGPGVLTTWPGPAGVPSLVVARTVAPTASSSGAPFEAVRDHLLSLPGLPEDVAAQLRAFAGDGATLPIPVPADLVTTSTARIGGAPATVLTARDRSVAAVVWVEAGVVTAVAGALDADEVLSIARDLR